MAITKVGLFEELGDIQQILFSLEEEWYGIYNWNELYIWTGQLFNAINLKRARDSKERLRKSDFLATFCNFPGFVSKNTPKRIGNTTRNCCLFVGKNEIDIIMTQIYSKEAARKNNLHV